MSLEFLDAALVPGSRWTDAWSERALEVVGLGPDEITVKVTGSIETGKLADLLVIDPII